jgi:hypothetical protein
MPTLFTVCRELSENPELLIVGNPFTGMTLDSLCVCTTSCILPPTVHFAVGSQPRAHFSQVPSGVRLVHRLIDWSSPSEGSCPPGSGLQLYVRRRPYQYCGSSVAGRECPLPLPHAIVHDISSTLAVSPFVTCTSYLSGGQVFRVANDSSCRGLPVVHVVHPSTR